MGDSYAINIKVSNYQTFKMLVLNTSYFKIYFK